MARTIEFQLYKELVSSCFQFVERGTREIQEIYDSVKHKFPDLCNDDFICPHRKKIGVYDYEWKHKIRSALQRCKIKCDGVSFSGKRGYWIFS